MQFTVCLEFAADASSKGELDMNLSTDSLKEPPTALEPIRGCDSERHYSLSPFQVSEKDCITFMPASCIATKLAHCLLAGGNCFTLDS